MVLGVKRESPGRDVHTLNHRASLQLPRTVTGSLEKAKKGTVQTAKVRVQVGVSAELLGKEQSELCGSASAF